MKLWAVFVLAGVAGSATAQSPIFPGYNTSYREAEPWQEQQEVEPPAFPKQENLREFYVSAVATNTYLIDASTLVVGADGVVRYVLVVQTSGGATNVSFEGMHCKELKWKHYATGRSDGTWTKSRATRIEWRPIENKPVNRHHAALSRDFFCPLGNAISTADEGRNALRLGKHPNSS
ncbi:MAG: CNP1-like family protein [Rhodocyclales bacterium]|nr:CNP1-like family protein [Rhodocyclales bacterium]